MTFEIESHLEDHAHSYQLGQGSQINVEHMYLGNQGSLPSPLSITLLGPLVRESDPLELGVHRAAISNGNAVPFYVQRDIDTVLTQRLTELAISGGFMVIVGDSTAGKSRVAYENLLRVVPNYRLIAPYDRDELRYSLGAIAMSTEKQVLWLDNLERFLGGDGLTPRIVKHLKYLKIMIVASMRTEHYRRLSRLSTTKVENQSGLHKELLNSEYALKQADVLTLDRRWTPDEIMRAQKAGDARIGEALQHVDVYGIAEYLAAGPMLYDEWRQAWEVGANPRGAALVAAAIDCHRSGLHDFVPIELLTSIHQYYLDAEGGSLLRPESSQSAIAWAAQRRAGVTSLLLPGKEPDTYRAFDYLADRVMLARDVAPVPNAVWHEIRTYVADDKHQLEEVAIAAASQDNVEVAEVIWSDLVANGNGNAAYQLGKLYRRLDRDDEAKRSYEQAVDLGEFPAASALGHLLQRDGDLEAAQGWFERGARNEDPHGMYHMGLICRNKGLEKDAERWFRNAVERNELIASSALGWLLLDSGRLNEAESALRTAADIGDVDATNCLAIVLDNLNRVDEAEELFKKLADAEVGTGEANLARLYRKQRRYADAETYYERALTHGVEDVEIPYASLLGERGNSAKARKILAGPIRANDGRAFRIMGTMAFQADSNLEAVNWFTKAMANGEDSEATIRMLADTLANVGRDSEAVQYWQRLVDDGVSDANYALGRIKREAGANNEAACLFRAAAEDGDAAAACQLAQIYAEQEKYEPAEECLLQSYKLGHAHAACLLGTMYANTGDLKKAETYWVHGYWGGHRHLASDISGILLNQGRGREAATWLRRIKEGPASAQRGGRSRRRRRRRRS